MWSKYLCCVWTHTLYLENVQPGNTVVKIHKTFQKQLQGWTPLLVLTGVATTLGSSIPVGYNIGVMNTPAHIIRDFCNGTVADHYGISMGPSQLNILWSIIVSIFLVGGVTGSLSGGWVADRFGRKGAVIINNVLGVLAAILFVSSRHAGSVEMLLLARLIVGLSSGLVTSTIPMYLTEIAPVSIRGAMGVLCPLGITVGVLVAQILGLRSVLGQDETWHYLLGLFALLTLLSAVALPFLPESPKYLYIVCGQEERGIKELSRLRGAAPEKLVDELEELRAAHKAEQELAASGVSWSMRSVACAPTLRLPLLLVCALQIGQQFSGINAVFYYSVTIFESAGLTKQGSQFASIGAGGINLLITIIAIPLVNRCGRRQLVIASCWTAAVCLVILCVSITYINAASWMPYFCIFTVLAYVFCYGFGLGPIPYFIGSELFQVGPRPIAMSFGSMANWCGNFIIGMTFPSLQSFIGQYSFLLFATTTVFLAVFLKYYLPESKGRDPCDIAEILKYGLRSQIHAPVSSSRTNHRNSSIICAPDAVSISSRHQRISDINPDSLVLEVSSPLSSCEAFSNSTVLSSPAAIIHHNNSYTNLPAIPELPGKNPILPSIINESSPSDVMSGQPVRSLPRIMPSIPENLAGASSQLEEVLTVTDG
ncbi:solute carrier family 2, facilitated glucose transporter member 3-like isoform X4 [Zootermopsis nevadensis]|uniref:solute carrier family 2, facilitated glucose transporter member 3-like isoform X4 n=1 Tax=Zootermopsis nevadensis TaxID=136037 RepID=UPI000B8E87ED|nr:solute carrier family 2, facilitated glucose transporter member 3-like isoform X4 [Zootermopsis nevadensis]